MQFLPSGHHGPTVHPCKSHELPRMLMYGPCRQKDPALRSDLQHSMGLDATCREMTRPLGSGTCTRNTRRTRVFFLPMSVSPFRSSMSAFRSFRMPAQSMLHRGEAGSLSRKVHPQTRPRWSTDCLLPTATAGNCISPGLVITRTLCQEVGFFKKKKKNYRALRKSPEWRLFL